MQNGKQSAPMFPSFRRKRRGLPRGVFLNRQQPDARLPDHRAQLRCNNSRVSPSADTTDQRSASPLICRAAQAATHLPPGPDDSPKPFLASNLRYPIPPNHFNKGPLREQSRRPTLQPATPGPRDACRAHITKLGHARRRGPIRPSQPNARHQSPRTQHHPTP